MSDIKQPEAAHDPQQLTDAELSEVSGGKPVTSTQTTTGGTGKVTVQDFTITHKVD